MNDSYFETFNFSKKDMIDLDIKLNGVDYPMKHPIVEKIGTTSDTIKIIKNYLSENEIELINNKMTYMFNRQSDSSHNHSQAESIILEYKNKIKLTAEELFDVTLEYDSYANNDGMPDNLLAGRKPNYVTAVHSDNLDIDRSRYGKYRWSGHISNLLYINDNYSGGELYFPEHDLLIKPEAGMLLSFPGHFWNRHGIFPASDWRFAMSIFYKIVDFDKV